MLKLLIADDEPYVRDYMKTLLDWKDKGIVLCECAGNSEEALRIAEKEKPDIAFLDINMPGMNGLQLTEILRSRLPDMEVAFVTGYSEFEYARKALQLGANEYLLKPFSREELENALRRLILKIRKRTQERYTSRKDRKILQDNFLRQQLFEFRNFNDTEDMKHKMERIGLTWLYDYFVVAQIDIHFSEQIREGDLVLWKFSIRNILEEFPTLPDTVLYTINGEMRKVCLLLNGKGESLSYDKLKKYLENIQKTIWDYLGILVTIGIGGKKNNSEFLHDSYRESIGACKEELTHGIGKLYFYEKIQVEEMKPGSKRAEEIICAIEQTIRDNYQDSELSIGKIAEKVHLDASYIRRIFSRYRGYTVVNYLAEYRIREAKKLLESENLSVTQVAEQVGFADPGYFSKCFKKYYGVTPSSCPVFSHF